MLWLGVVAWSVSAAVAQEPPTPVQAEPQTVEEWLARIEERILSARTVTLVTRGTVDRSEDVGRPERDEVTKSWEMTVRARPATDELSVRMRLTGTRHAQTGDEPYGAVTFHLVASPSGGQWRAEDEGSGPSPEDRVRRHSFQVEGHPARDFVRLVIREAHTLPFLDFDMVLAPQESHDFGGIYGRIFAAFQRLIPDATASWKMGEGTIERGELDGRRVVILHYTILIVFDTPAREPHHVETPYVRRALTIDEETSLPIRDVLEWARRRDERRREASLEVRLDEEIPDAEFTIDETE